MATTLGTQSLADEIRQALRLGQLEPYYQPIYSLKERRIAGLESLVRWNHPSLGLLLPGEFISTAEHEGLICEIDVWMLRTAADQLNRWRRSVKFTEDLFLSCNVSAAHFERMQILDDITEVLEASDVPPAALRLELTESLFMNFSILTDELFAALNLRGIHLSIDDFGVGFSSLARLARLPVHTLKIDQGFTQKMAGDRNVRSIVKALINLAHDLDMMVVAEGVGCSAHAELLEQFGCDYLQGELVSMPVAAKDIPDVIAAWHGRAIFINQGCVTSRAR